MAMFDKSDKEIPSEDENFDITSDEAVAEEPVVEQAEVSGVAEESTPEAESEATPVPTTVRPDIQPALATPKASTAHSQVVKSAKRRGPWLHLAIEAVLAIAVVVLVLMLANVTSDKHNLTKQLASAKANPQNLVQQQTNSLIAQVSTLMQLPTGETPTVAQVSDATAAKKQSAFFNNAENGDKVLLYVKAGEAILYRPSTNKIVLVAPLTFSNTTPGTTAK